MFNNLRSLGVTKIRTRRDHLRTVGRVLLAVLGAGLCLLIGAGLIGVATGQGWHLPHVGFRSPLSGTGPWINAHADAKSARHLQSPVTVMFFPWARIGWAAVAALPLWALWLWVQTRRGRRVRHAGPVRWRGFATLPQIRKMYGTHAVRKTGKFTLPETTWWNRLWLPTVMFGAAVGQPMAPQDRMQVRLNMETRLRIVARSGWGKSWRLLIPMIRQATGAALITSVEAEIFTATVKARMWRLPPVRWEWMRILRKTWRTPRRYPVVVADLAAPESRMAAGFPQLRWNPIIGCENFRVAANRAHGLVAGGDTDEKGGGETDKFFRDSAAQVLAAWLQAAALDPGKDIEDLVQWLRTTDLGTPTEILQGNTTPEARAAVMNMVTHLDPAAGRTTSGVKRYLNFAISSLASGAGRALCGPRSVAAQFDMAKLIAAGGTVYLLAEPEEMELARPLLTLLADEMFRAAERTARRLPGARHRHTFMGFFDELKAGVRLSILPYVATVQRKYGISYVYAIQSSSDEDEMYGSAAAKRLRGQAVTILGGYDADSAPEVNQRAGKTPVVTATRGGGGHHSEHIQLEDTLPVSDIGALENGQSVLVGLGIHPFLVTTERVDHQRSARNTISRERREVEKFVSRRRDQDRSTGTGEHMVTAGGFVLDL